MNVLSLAEEDTQLHKAAINEMAGPCPGCGGKDRFRVRYNRDTGEWLFMCRSCYDAGQYLPDKGHKRGWGDDISYLCHFRKKTFQEAKALARSEVEIAQVTRQEPLKARYLSDEWQTSTAMAMQEHQARMWSDDHTALEYCKARGLYEHMVKQFQLGYSLHKGIPSLVVPSINEGRYVSVSCRDMRIDRPDDAPRWKEVTGGGKDELYLADCLVLHPDKPVVVVEDALSAISIYQECGDVVNVAATCGVTCCMTTKWIARLACMPLVLIALDADRKGDKRSIEWLARLKNARRLRPLLKDANDMLVDGWDLREWIVNALAPAQEPFLCVDCGMDGSTALEDVTFSYDENGKVYCPECWARRQVPITSPAALPQRMTHTQFMDVAQRIADSIPGCQVHIDPPGYTIQDRAREILADRVEAAKKSQDYWSKVHEKLARSGYYERFARDQAEIKRRWH